MTLPLLFVLAAVSCAQAQLLRSSELGITKCELQASRGRANEGRVEDKPVLLYVFITACSAGTWRGSSIVPGSEPGSGSKQQAGGGTLHVAGHFFLHDPARPIRTTQLQAVDEAKDWAVQEGALLLKSPHTGREWPLTLQLAGPWSNPHRHRYPGRLSAVLTDLDPVDAALLEFHVLARPDFHTSCTFLASTARAPAWPPPVMRARDGDDDGGEAHTGAEERDARRRRRRRARRQLWERSVLGLQSGDSSDGAGDADQSEEGRVQSGGDLVGRRIGHSLDIRQGPQHCGWLDETGAEIEDELTAARTRPSYMVVSPFFGLPASEYASLLLHHMRYHDVLGVRRYLVYVEAGASALAADSRVQAAVAGGRLRLVLWEEVPHFLEQDTGRRHPYASQSLVYNHGLLALWHELAVAAIADVDEYLVTPERTTLAQVLEGCAEAGTPPAASLQVTRRVGYCTGCVDAISGGGGGGGAGGSRGKRSPADRLDKGALSAAHPLERALWLNGSALARQEAYDGVLAAAAAAGFPPRGHGDGGGGGGGAGLVHPLALYGVSTGDAEPKSVLLVHRAAFSNPHITYPLPGQRGSGASTYCAYWLHLRSQVALRLSGGRPTDVREVKRASLWVLDELYGSEL
ncbi:hypothetical protein HYH02_001152 [Chlamydomonas schloesseri]|uniref:Glycosyltransferase family 92 protein n=1 Tax=Chlamydomonas schloesseri TaxID=2026947 RepID=A0A835WVU0_9CHLO|nr:hypothetical protein HYH02_001152 [Chlamydomonas schloesseri]|eukprot:KAG2454113.1 hypothetical protein HYH02_001152 [Chlamydomonas schloesseri]